MLFALTFDNHKRVDIGLYFYIGNIEIVSEFNYHAVYSKISINFAVGFRNTLYIMSIEKANKINRLLREYYPGKLYFSGSLKQNGYSDQLLKQYRSSGWLSALSKGIMYRAGDRLLSYPALACYNWQMGKIFM